MQKKVVIATILLARTGSVLASGEGGASNPFAGDIGTALWTVLIFVMVLIVLGKFAWGPILGALQKREDFIHDSLDQAKKNRLDAEQTLKEYTQKLEAARDEATGIVEEGRRDAETVRQKIEGDARREAQAMVDRAKREIAMATDTAVKKLYDVSGTLATEIASRIIRKELDASEHERLVAESIADLDKAIKRNGSG